MKNKTPSTVPLPPSNTSFQTSNVSSIMTSLTETTQSTIDRHDLDRPTDTSIDSIAIKTKSKSIILPFLSTFSRESVLNKVNKGIRNQTKFKTFLRLKYAS